MTTAEIRVAARASSSKPEADAPGQARLTKHLAGLARSYPKPFVMLGLLMVSLGLDWHADGLGDPLAAVVIGLGSFRLLRDTISAIRHRRYAVDYLALLAISAAVAAGEFQVGAVIALMLASGQALEDFGVRRAQRSLSLLADRIPRTAVVQHPHQGAMPVAVDAIGLGATVLVRHGEVLPLDGTLVSEQAEVDESSLTGEPYLLHKVRGDQVRSGTVNQGPPLLLQVTRAAHDSTYRQILALVEAAQDSGAPMVRLADRYSLAFTLVAIALAVGAWWLSGSLERALAVLVVATPCPLILAVPIAQIGGVNRAARYKIIVKRMAALEALARVSFLILDKTGTITVGRPELVRIERLSDNPLSDDDVLALVAAVERHSLHPIAKALVEAAQQRGLRSLPVSDVIESTGRGIQASVEGHVVAVHGASSADGEMRIACEVDGRMMAAFVLQDRIKDDARAVFTRILELGVDLSIATGDRQEAAERVIHELGLPLRVDAQCTPEAKLAAIKRLQRSGQLVGMVGDGINDAPALAQANVALVFTNEARTAASEAADIALLGGSVEQVWQALHIARDTLRVATQGVLVGIGLSILAMMAAAAGWLPPLAGAFLQEGIDVLVIANALRATTGSLD